MYINTKYLIIKSKTLLKDYKLALQVKLKCSTCTWLDKILLKQENYLILNQEMLDHISVE